MRNYILFIMMFVGGAVTVNAKTHHTNYQNNTPFVFVENNVEYAVFKNGEFDFNILNNRYTQQNRIGNVNISFNTGCNYNTYVERNSFGDIVQINRTPIYYNRYGSVSRIGNIQINYNRYGYINNIGQLCINYNYANNNYSCTGFVNSQNRRYNARFHHYATPSVHHHLYKNRNLRSQGYSYYGKSQNYRPVVINQRKNNSFSNKRAITRKSIKKAKKYYSNRDQTARYANRNNYLSSSQNRYRR